MCLARLGGWPEASTLRVTSRNRLYNDFLAIDDELGPLQKQLEEQAEQQAQVLGKKWVRKTRLGESYLSVMRQAVLSGLEGGESDPFAMVAMKMTGAMRA